MITRITVDNWFGHVWLAVDVPKDRIGRCILEGCGKHGSKNRATMILSKKTDPHQDTSNVLISLTRGCEQCCKQQNEERFTCETALATYAIAPQQSKVTMIKNHGISLYYNIYIDKP